MRRRAGVHRQRRQLGQCHARPDPRRYSDPRTSQPGRQRDAGGRQPDPADEDSHRTRRRYASATANIGQNLHFEDDGPSAAIVTTGQGVSVDESSASRSTRTTPRKRPSSPCSPAWRTPGVDTRHAAICDKCQRGRRFDRHRRTAPMARDTTAFSLNVSVGGRRLRPQHDRRQRTSSCSRKAT